MKMKWVKYGQKSNIGLHPENLNLNEWKTNNLFFSKQVFIYLSALNTALFFEKYPPITEIYKQKVRKKSEQSECALMGCFQVECDKS